MGGIEVVEFIKSKYPDAVLDTVVFREQVGVYIKKEFLLPIVSYLAHTENLEFDLLKDLCGVDYLGKKHPRFEVVYHLYSIKFGNMLRLNVPVGEDEPAIDSLTDIYVGANWHERECYDMFGITFKGHPDLRRILMPEDWDGYPLRKDYPTAGPAEDWHGYTEVLQKAEEYRQHEWNR